MSQRFLLLIVLALINFVAVRGIKNTQKLIMSLYQVEVNHHILVPDCDKRKYDYAFLNINLNYDIQSLWVDLILHDQSFAVGVVDQSNKNTVQSIIPAWLCGERISVIKHGKTKPLNLSEASLSLKTYDIHTSFEQDKKKYSYPKLKEEALKAAYEKNYAAFPFYLNLLQSKHKPHGYWGILSDMAEVYGPLGSVFIYEFMRKYHQELDYLNLLNGIWNKRKVTYIYKHSQGREKIYAIAKLGIMGKIWPLADDIQMIEQKSEGLAQADAYWAMGKINHKAMHKAYFDFLMEHIETSKDDVRKQFLHALSNFRQKPAEQFVFGCLNNKKCWHNTPSALDHLYATIGRLRLEHNQAWLIEHLDKNANPYIQAIIANFVGDPLTEESEIYIMDKLSQEDYPEHLKYELLKNCVDAKNTEFLDKNQLSQYPLLKLYLQSKSLSP